MVKSFAEALGYLIGIGSLTLYAPIAVRIIRQKSADGLTLSTWWLKLISFTCTDVYNIYNGYPISAYSETLVITFEAAAILALVSFYQRRPFAITFTMAAIYLSVTAWALASPPGSAWGPTDEGIALTQGLSTILNTSALLPQLAQNARRKSAGDYSAVTASIASVGCTIRLFTTIELAGGDPLLLFNYGVALLLNASLLLEILWYGTKYEGQSVASLFLADVKKVSK